MFKSFFTACIASVALGAIKNVDYTENGKNWATLDPTGNALCDSGKAQSPIDLPTSVDGCAACKIVLDSDYGDGTMTTTKHYDTIQTTLTSGGFTKTFPSGANSSFKARQFHMHAPSEHTVDGKHYDLELHIVHEFADGGYGGVLGIFFDQEAGGSGTNLFLDSLPDSLFTNTAQVGDTATSNMSVKGWLDTWNLNNHWSYDGSLTTPACTEGIKWTVFQDVQPISATQLAKFKNLWEATGNNRLVQPLNDRQLVLAGKYVATAEEEQYRAATIALAVVLGIVAIAVIAFVTILLVKPEWLKLKKVDN